MSLRSTLETPQRLPERAPRSMYPTTLWATSGLSRWPQDDPKMTPRWFQDGSKMIPKYTCSVSVTQNWKWTAFRWWKSWVSVKLCWNRLHKTGNEQLTDDENVEFQLKLVQIHCFDRGKEDENVQFQLNLTKTEHSYRDKKVQFQLSLTETEHFYPGIR